jgi:hypothetical protein
MTSLFLMTSRKPDDIAALRGQFWLSDPIETGKVAIILKVLQRE